MWIFSGLFQAAVVTALNLRTLRGRLASSGVAVVGMAGVVAVLVSVLSIAEGIRATMANTGSPDTAIVMRTGSDSEMTSILLNEDMVVVKDAPEIAREPGVGPLASAELFVGIDLVKGQHRNDGERVAARRRAGRLSDSPLQDDRGPAIRDRPERDHRRQGGCGRVPGLASGSPLKLGQNPWTIVGIFDAGGTVPDSEVWCDARVLAPLYRRGNSRQTVLARLTSAEAFTAFKDRLTADPRVKLKVMREQEDLRRAGRTLSQTIVVIGGVIGLLMGIGALFVAIITMHSAVASRTREIATLRALGFRGGPVVISVLIESMILAIVGGGLGAAVAYFGFNGYQAATMNWTNMSSIGFAFRVTPALLVLGVGWALALGVLGGLFPAIRAMRLPIVKALREL